MRMTFEYTAVSIDVGKYMRLLDKALATELKEGGRLWLEAVLKVIPVWSGASHGTFVKMSQKLGMSITVSGTSA